MEVRDAFVHCHMRLQTVLLLKGLSALLANKVLLSAVSQHVIFECMVISAALLANLTLLPFLCLLMALGLVLRQLFLCRKQGTTIICLASLDSQLGVDLDVNVETFG